MQGMRTYNFQTYTYSRDLYNGLSLSTSLLKCFHIHFPEPFVDLQYIPFVRTQTVGIPIDADGLIPLRLGSISLLPPKGIPQTLTSELTTTVFGAWMALTARTEDAGHIILPTRQHLM